MVDETMQVSARPEEMGDYAVVREVNELAFGRPEEARLVDAVRGSGDAVSLVAAIDGEVVGHILFTRVEIGAGAASVKAAGLAPMAVRPEHQRAGIGSQLVRAGLEACRRLGYDVVVVLGHPGFYPRFGFVPANTKGLAYESPVPPEAFMVVELTPGTLRGVTGVVRYHREFSMV